MAELPEPAFWESAGDLTDDPNVAEGWALEHEAGTRSALTTLYTADQLRAAIQAERERCAKLCEAEALDDPCDTPDDIAYDNAVRDCAAAIRGQAEGRE